MRPMAGETHHHIGANTDDRGHETKRWPGHRDIRIVSPGTGPSCPKGINIFSKIWDGGVRRVPEPRASAPLKGMEPAVAPGAERRSSMAKTHKPLAAGPDITKIFIVIAGTLRGLPVGVLNPFNTVTGSPHMPG